MSLIGSLEDLSLGELLQVVSLSRRSGVLSLQSRHGEGWILMRHGEVRGAHAKGVAADLRSLLLSAGALDASTFERAESVARAQERSPAEVLVLGGALSAERLDALRRAHIQGAVVGMCGWTEGEFRFEPGDPPGTADPDLLAQRGLAAEFLAIEGARLRDEARDGEPALDVFLDDEVRHAVTEAAYAAAVGRPRAPAVEPAAGEPPPASIAERKPDDEPPAPPEPVGEADPDERVVIAVDGDLVSLEWVRGALTDAFARVHVFQRPEQGVDRVRQYLARAHAPILLLDPDLPPDPLTGARNAAALVRRLKAMSARLRVLWLEPRGVRSGRGGRAPHPADGVVEKPPRAALVDPRRTAEVRAMADALREALLHGCEGP